MGKVPQWSFLVWAELFHGRTGYSAHYHHSQLWMVVICTVFSLQKDASWKTLEVSNSMFLFLGGLIFFLSLNSSFVNIFQISRWWQKDSVPVMIVYKSNIVLKCFVEEVWVMPRDLTSLKLSVFLLKQFCHIFPESPAEVNDAFVKLES